MKNKNNKYRPVYANHKPKKQYGQNFLTDKSVLIRTAEAVPAKANELIFEIGPGPGNLTEYLLQKGCNVVSVEMDNQFTGTLNNLKGRFWNFEWILADALHVNFAEMAGGKDYHIAGNIPYYITAKLISHAISQSVPPKSVTFLVQKEVAHNLEVKKGFASLQSLGVGLFGDVKILEIVPKDLFEPAPKVDSAVIQITPNPKQLSVTKEELFRVAKNCYKGKRKQLKNTLLSLGLGKEETDKALLEAGIEGALRPESLTLEQWDMLVSFLKRV